MYISFLKRAIGKLHNISSSQVLSDADVTMRDIYYGTLWPQKRNLCYTRNFRVVFSRHICLPQR